MARRLKCIAFVTAALMLGERAALFAVQKSPVVAVARKKLDAAGLSVEVAARFVTLICEKGDADDLAFVYGKFVAAQDVSPQLKASALDGLLAAAMTRKLQPEGDVASIADLIRPDAPGENSKLQITATRLAGLWKVAAASKKLLAIATARDTPGDMRRAAVDGLIALGDAEAPNAFNQLAAKNRPLDQRALGVAAMAAIELDRAARMAPPVLADWPQDDDLGAMVSEFLDRRNGAEKLAAAVAANPPPADAAKRALQYVYSVGRGDSPLALALSDAAGLGEGPKPPTPEEFRQLVADVAAHGDPHRGEAVFRRADLNCMKCHALNKAGGDIGPDLAAVGTISPIDYLLASVLDPDQAIKEVYQTRIFATVDGELLQGIVLKRGGGIVEIKESNGAIRKLAEVDIDMEKEGKSLMPKGLVKFMTRQDLLDLVRFLAELGKPGDFALPASPSIARWRLLKRSPDDLQTAVPDAATFERELQRAADDAWFAAYARASGELPLDECARRTRQNVLYLYGEIDVTAAGTIELVPNAASGLDAWVDGRKTDIDGTIDIESTPGRHRIMFRVDLAAFPSKSFKVEVRKPAGSAAKFTCVGGP